MASPDNERNQDGPDNPSWRRRVAAHEAGHALLAWTSPYVTEVGHITLDIRRLWPDRMILSGLTAYSVPISAAGDPRHHWNQIVIGLGGMAGEAFLLGSVKSLGCAVDLAGAKGYAELIVRRHGGKSLDWLPWPDPDAGRRPALDLGKMFTDALDPTVRGVLNACYRRARTGVVLYPDKLAAVMNALMASDRLDNDCLERLMGPRPLWC